MADLRPIPAIAGERKAQANPGMTSIAINARMIYFSGRRDRARNKGFHSKSRPVPVCGV